MNATSDTASGGLGFDYVWEIGWTQDTLAYFAAPFGGRSALFRQLCGSFGPFGAVQGINALSHDENHPASIFTRLYGNVEEKLAQMRLLLLLQAAAPAKACCLRGWSSASRMPLPMAGSRTGLCWRTPGTAPWLITVRR